MYIWLLLDQWVTKGKLENCDVILKKISKSQTVSIQKSMFLFKRSPTWTNTIHNISVRTLWSKHCTSCKYCISKICTLLTYGRNLFCLPFFKNQRVKKSRQLIGRYFFFGGSLYSFSISCHGIYLFIGTSFLPFPLIFLNASLLSDSSESEIEYWW